MLGIETHEETTKGKSAGSPPRSISNSSSQPLAVSQMEHDKREVRGIDPTKLYDNLLTFHNRWVKT